MVVLNSSDESALSERLSKIETAAQSWENTPVVGPGSTVKSTTALILLGGLNPTLDGVIIDCEKLHDLPDDIKLTTIESVKFAAVLGVEGVIGDAFEKRDERAEPGRVDLGQAKTGRRRGGPSRSCRRG